MSGRLRPDAFELLFPEALMATYATPVSFDYRPSGYVYLWRGRQHISIRCEAGGCVIECPDFDQPLRLSRCGPEEIRRLIAACVDRLCDPTW